MAPYASLSLSPSGSMHECHGSCYAWASQDHLLQVVQRVRSPGRRKPHRQMVSSPCPLNLGPAGRLPRLLFRCRCNLPKSQPIALPNCRCCNVFELLADVDVVEQHVYDYGRGTVSPLSRLPHCTLVALAMLAPPVINDLESQNRSVPFPLIWVEGFVPVATATVDRLATT